MAATKNKTAPAPAAAAKTKPKVAGTTIAPALKPTENSSVTFMDGRLRSPEGVSSYAYLNKPDPKFGHQKISLDFKVTDPEFKKMAAMILKFENDHLKANGKKPVTTPSCIVPATDKDKQEIDGVMRITFKRDPKEDGQGGHVPVPCVDHLKQDCSTRVNYGSICRVGYGLGFWNSAGRMGTKCYLNAVQVLKAAAGGRDAGSYFDVDESYVSDLTDGVEDEGDTDAVDTSDVVDEATDGDDLLGD